MKPFLLSLISAAAAVAVLNGCTDHSLPGDNYPDRAEAQNPTIITQVGNVKVYNGGFGSAVVQDPNDHMAFYLLTDRGSDRRHRYRLQSIRRPGLCAANRQVQTDGRSTGAGKDHRA